jgi:hypothetical protein
MPLNQFGPVQFSVEGTFTDKPRLLMDGEEVPFDSLSIFHDPGFKFTNEAGKEEVIPPSTHLSFSVSAKIGQLEANVGQVSPSQDGREGREEG